MRIALIEPAVDAECLVTALFAQIRSALPFLAGALRDRGHAARIYAEELIVLAPRLPALARDHDAAGISVTINTVRRAVGIARALKALRPALPVIFGGAGARHHADTLLPHGDFVLDGRAEVTLPGLLDALAAGDLAAARALPNLSFRRDGATVHTPLRSLPADHRSDFSAIERYGGLSERRNILGLRKPPLHSLFASTGCVRRCRFCVTEKRHIPRRTEDFAADLAAILERHRTPLPPRIMVVDDCPFGDPAHLDRLLAIMADARRARPFGAMMQFHVLPLVRDPGLPARIAEAGIHTLLLGFESVSDRSLELERKGTTLADNRAAIRACRAAGLTPYGYFVAGFDGDDEAAVRGIFEFIEREGIAAQVLPMGVTDERTLDPFSFGATLFVSHRPARMSPARLQELLIDGCDRIWRPGRTMRMGGRRDALHQAAFALAWPRWRPALLRHLAYLRLLDRFAATGRSSIK